MLRRAAESLTVAFVMSAAACGHGSRPDSTMERMPQTYPAFTRVSIGADTQRLNVSELGIPERDAWLATNPRLEMTVFGQARIVLPVVAAEDPNSVVVVGHFDDGEGQRLYEVHEDDSPAGEVLVRWRTDEGGTVPTLIRSSHEAQVHYTIDRNLLEHTYEVSCAAEPPGEWIGARIVRVVAPNGRCKVGPIEIRIIAELD